MAIVKALLKNKLSNFAVTNVSISLKTFSHFKLDFTAIHFSRVGSNLFFHILLVDNFQKISRWEKF
ncbi:MAG: hypothetical protein RLY40_676 [Pseudomonadota bacterium]|jgi:hypothetical protein